MDEAVEEKDKRTGGKGWDKGQVARGNAECGFRKDVATTFRLR